MPTPFPGMDPYLEHPNHWHGFHTKLVVQMTYSLVRGLPGGYFADTEEMLFIHKASAEERRQHYADADASIALHPSRRQSGGEDGGGVALAAMPPPTLATVPMPVHVEKHHYIAIRDRAGNRGVTVIDLLSPTNKKPGGNRQHYLAKRIELLGSDTHFIEIDLLRVGPRMSMDLDAEAAYCVMVSRAGERPRVEVWPIVLRDPLPTIPVPLNAGDADVTLDIRSAIDRVYDDGGYAKRIYLHDPDPPLEEEDAAWAERLANTAGAGGALGVA